MISLSYSRDMFGSNMGVIPCAIETFITPFPDEVWEGGYFGIGCLLWRWFLKFCFIVIVHWNHCCL